MAGVTLKGFVTALLNNVANPFRVETKCPNYLSQGFKANPGLELANTFGVKNFVRKKNKKLSVCFTVKQLNSKSLTPSPTDIRMTAK